MEQFRTRFRDNYYAQNPLTSKGFINFTLSKPLKHFGWELYNNVHPSLALKKIRYLKWLDNNDFVISRNRYSVSGLAHKRTFIIPSGFDHTINLRKKGERFPSLIITEPYNLPRKDDLERWKNICDHYDLEYKIFDPSSKSLWYPYDSAGTYMIFWWCKKYQSFDPEWMNHKTYEEIIDECEITYDKGYDRPIIEVL